MALAVGLVRVQPGRGFGPPTVVSSGVEGSVWLLERALEKAAEAQALLAELDPIVAQLHGLSRDPTGPPLDALRRGEEQLRDSRPKIEGLYRGLLELRGC